jgi:type II secretory pathway component GspD/PulD (secretin)
LKKSSIVILFSAFSLIAASSIYAQTPAKMLPLVAEVEVMTAFVVDVDLQNRTIELKDTSGNLYQMKVSKQVNDLDKVKKSDVFVVESAQSIAVGLVAAPKGQKPGVSSARSVTVSAKGSAKPFEEITDTVFATLKINTIDSKKRTVTFIWPSGERQKVKVDKSVLGLENFKAGDDVMIEFVDDTIIAFTAPAKTKK